MSMFSLQKNKNEKKDKHIQRKLGEYNKRITLYIYAYNIAIIITFTKLMPLNYIEILFRLSISMTNN